MTSLDHTELSTVLAALRFYQSRGLGEPANRPDDIHEIATDGGTVMASLDDEGIDSLCERLNAPAADPLRSLLVEFDSRFGDSVQDDLGIDGGDAVEWISNFAPQVREALNLCAAARQQVTQGPKDTWMPVTLPPDVSGEKFDYCHQSVPVLVKDAAGRVCVGRYAVDPDGEDPPRWVEDGRDGYEINRPVSWRTIPGDDSSCQE